jgi:hypothetical protein
MGTDQASFVYASNPVRQQTTIVVLTAYSASERVMLTWFCFLCSGMLGSQVASTLGPNRLPRSRSSIQRRLRPLPSKQETSIFLFGEAGKKITVKLIDCTPPQKTQDASCPRMLAGFAIVVDPSIVPQ